MKLIYFLQSIETFPLTFSQVCQLGQSRFIGTFPIMSAFHNNFTYIAIEDIVIQLYGRYEADELLFRKNIEDKPVIAAGSNAWILNTWKENETLINVFRRFQTFNGTGFDHHELHFKNVFVQHIK